MHLNIYSSTIYNSQVLETTYVPISKWVDQKRWYIYTMEYYAVERKKELLPFTTAWMGLESIILGSEKQIPYDLIYKWNLINKTNKWAK